MIFSRFIITSIVFITHIVTSLTLNMECSFDIASPWANYDGTVAGKRCSVINLLTKQPENITTVNDTSGNRYHSENVKILRIESQTAYFLPNDIEKHFPHLEALMVLNSELKQISRHNMEVFPALKQLVMYQNHLERLDSNLLEFNLALNFVDFSNNKLKEVGEALFMPLPHLVYAYFKGNLCIDKDAYAEDSINQLKALFKEKCPHSSEIKEQYCKDEMAEIKLLKIELEETKKKLADLKNQLISYVNKF